MWGTFCDFGVRTSAQIKTGNHFCGSLKFCKSVKCLVEKKPITINHVTKNLKHVISLTSGSRFKSCLRILLLIYNFFCYLKEVLY